MFSAETMTRRTERECGIPFMSSTWPRGIWPRWRLSDQPACFTVNLGTGKGNSVLDVVKAFEQASGRSIPYSVQLAPTWRYRRLLCSNRSRGEVFRWMASHQKSGNHVQGSLAVAKPKSQRVWRVASASFRFRKATGRGRLSSKSPEGADPIVLSANFQKRRNPRYWANGVRFGIFVTNDSPSPERQSILVR